MELLDQIADSLCRAWQDVTGDTPTQHEARASLSFCDIRFGDLASAIALARAKKVGQPARAVATRVAERLIQEEAIASCDVAGPGFVNLRLSDHVWSKLAADLRGNFFVTNEGKGTKVNIEFISANPTGPLVLVNAWGGFYGDILARLFTSQGYDVTREYYLNDGGTQIAQLGRAVQQAAGKEFTEETAAELYRGQYIDDLATQLSQEWGSREALVAADPMAIGERAKDQIFEYLIRPTLQRLGIYHDIVFSERKLDNTQTIARLEQVGAIKRYDGAVWLSGKVAGLDKDEVLVRSGGGGDTYFLKDISYQLNKLEQRGYNTAITIVGPDHHGQEQRLVAALHLLGHDNFVPLWTQTVRLIKDGQEFKMSKRRGNYIILDEFLDVVPVDTARFFFGLRDTKSHFDLDLDVISVQNKHNPLYYVMYSYVRANSVLSKADVMINDQSWVPTDDQHKVLRDFLKLAESIKASTTTYQVHAVLYDLIEIARSFHDWYEHHPILALTDSACKKARLVFVAKYREALGSLLDLIGISPVEKM